MANKTKLEQLDVQNITNNGSAVGFENGLVVPTGVDIRTGAAGIKEDNQGNVIVNGNNYGVIATSDNRNIFNEPNTFNRSVLLPGSPTTPDKATVTDTYSTRVTAKGIYDVVDGAITQVTKISGKTVKSENILVFNDYSGTSNGITYNLKNGVLTLNGTATAQVNFGVTIYGKTLKAGKYSFQVFGYSRDLGINYTIQNNNGQYLFYNTSDGASTIYTMAFTEETPLKGWYVIIPSGTTLSNVVLKPMLVEGDTAPTEFKEGFNGLKHAYFKGVRSIGRQLLDRNDYKIIDTDYAYSVKALAVGKSYRVAANQAIIKVLKISPRYNAPWDNSFGADWTLHGSQQNIGFSTEKYPLASTLPIILENKYIFITITVDGVSRMATPEDIEKYGIMIYEGAESDYAYEEYKEDTSFAYTEAQELKEWDYLLPQEGKKGEQTQVVAFDGTEKFHLAHISNSDGTDFVFALDISATPQDTASCENVISNNYSTAKGITRFFMSNNTIVQGGTNEPNYIFIRDDRFTTVDEWKAHLAELATAGNPLTVAYKTATATVTMLDNIPKSYTVYDGGTETIIQGNEDNSIYGAMPTITQTYSILVNPIEAANKAYVNNGLATKLDKSGGTITGNLIVEGKTDTALGAIVSKQNGIAYGLAYDGDAYKLGEGTINNESGEFTFNSGEGLPIALRDDNSTFTDGNLVKWSEDGNKLVDSNISSNNIATKEYVEENATKIYDSQSGTVKVDSLRIYIDANGYLYIETK